MLNKFFVGLLIAAQLILPAQSQAASSAFRAGGASVSASPDYSPVSYTPTFTGFGTVSTSSCTHARSGKFLVLDCKFTTGTPTAVETRISLPSGLVPDVASIRHMGTMVYGHTDALSLYVLVEPGNNYVTFSRQGSSFNSLVKLDGSNFWSGTEYHLTARIPIVGWTTGAIQTANINVGGEWVGSIRYGIDGVNQFTGTTAGWNNFPAYSGVAATASGNASAPATKVPAITLTVDPLWVYNFVVTGSPGAAGTHPYCNFRMSDGTDVSAEGTAGVYNAADVRVPTMNLPLKPTSGGSKTYNLQYQIQNGTSCFVNLTYTGFQIDVYRTPKQSSQTVDLFAAGDYGWTGYSPTVTGLGTATASNFQHKRIGDTLHVKGEVTAGTVAASLASISLPSGLEIDPTKNGTNNTSGATGPTVGEYRTNGANITGPLVTATGTSTTLVYYGNTNNVANAAFPVNGSTIFGNGALSYVKFSVPIKGWDTFPTGVAVSGGTGSAESVTKDIAQTAHGLAVGDVVRLNGTSYVEAQADSDANAEAIGIVSAVADANNFTLTTHGEVTGLSGLTAGTAYYLSATTPGALTATQPSSGGQISKPVLIASATTAGYFINYRGLVVAGSSSGTGGFTDWAPSLATVNCTTVANNQLFERIEGDSLHIRGVITCSAVGTATAAVVLNGGRTINSGKLAYLLTPGVGTWRALTSANRALYNGSQEGALFVDDTDLTKVFLANTATSYAYDHATNFSIQLGANEALQVDLLIPIN